LARRRLKTHGKSGLARPWLLVRASGKCNLEKSRTEAACRMKKEGADSSAGFRVLCGTQEPGRAFAAGEKEPLLVVGWTLRWPRRR
jgi:hypothetical protein